MELYDMLARAFSRKKRFADALEIYDHAVVVCDRIGDFKRQGRLLCCKAEMQRVQKQMGAAKLTYEKVQRLGEINGGCSELHSKACAGLSDVARLEGRLPQALELAHESLKAVGCIPDGQYARDRDEANAIVCIVECSDLYGADFDDSLLSRLSKLTISIDVDDREGGSTLCIRAQEFQARRHLDQGRITEGAEAYRELIRLAAEHRFLQMVDVQAKSHAAKETLVNLIQLGLIEISKP